MKKIKIITCGIFQTITPLCTMSTIKDGESGFLREEDVVFYRKKDNKQYLRIRKDAPIYEHQNGCNMINVWKCENEIEIEANPEGFFYVEDEFNFDPIDFTAEAEIKHEEYLPYDSSIDPGPKNRVNEIMEYSKGFQELHRNLIDYSWDAEAEETGMERLVELIGAEMKRVLPETKLDILYIFQDEFEQNEEHFEDQKERIKERNGISAEEEIDILRILGDYFIEVKQVLKKAIQKQENRLPDPNNFNKYTIDQLLDLRESEKDPTKKVKIEEELTKRSKPNPKPKGGSE